MVSQHMAEITSSARREGLSSPGPDLVASHAVRRCKMGVGIASTSPLSIRPTCVLPLGRRLAGTRSAPSSKLSRPTQVVMRPDAARSPTTTVRMAQLMPTDAPRPSTRCLRPPFAVRLLVRLLSLPSASKTALTLAASPNARPYATSETASLAVLASLLASARVVTSRPLPSSARQVGTSR